MNLNGIQQKLKAPKNQKNTFGGYMYRNCEDILEAVKPLLGESTLILTDEVVCVGGKNYVKATASLSYKITTPEHVKISMSGIGDSGTQTTSVSAYAREADEQKGMSPSQITGSASSYARKYALNGLFLIDDTKDDDNREHTPAPKGVSVPVNQSPLTPYQQAQKAIKASKDKSSLEKAALRIKESVTFSPIEIMDLLTEVDFQGAELGL